MSAQGFTAYEVAALTWYLESGRRFEPEATTRDRVDAAIASLERHRETLRSELEALPPKPRAKGAT